MSPRYQSLIRRLMAVLLVVAVVAGSPLTKATLTPSAARASTFCPQSSSQIVQCNALGENFYTGIERPLIDDILQTYDLPPTDSDRLLSWQRDMVRASVFAELVSIINTPADQRTVDEQTAVNDLASLVELQRWKAASDAKQEYNTWAANPCGYNPPGPFAGTYDVYDYCNSSQIAFGPPFPPTLQDFEHYGVYLANRDYYTNPGLSGISQGGAYALGLLGGAVAAGAAAGTLALVPDVSSALTAAIFPYHFAISFTTTASGEIVAAPEALAVSGAELAGPAAVLILAVTSIILGSIEISANEQIPAELDQGIAAAQSPVDLAGLLKSKQGTQEVWMAFIRTTMPGYNTSQPDTVDFPHSVPAPAYTATDRKFKIFAPDGSATETGQLTYLDWAGHQQTAWLDGGWFVVEDSDHNLSLSLSIQVLAGSIFYVVNRHGDDFFYVDQNGDTGLGLPPTAFNYRSWTGETDEAHLAPPDGTPPYIDVTAVTTDGAGDAVPYILGTTATEDVTLTFTCGDADGPDDIAVCPAPMTFHGPISTTVRVWASDYSGNVENNVLGQVIIWPNGYNPPTISASATTEDGQPYVAGTWTDQTVTVHYDCEDPVSGVLSCSSDHVFADEGIASASGAVVANSNFENTTTFGPVQIDKTPPTINASAKTADGNAYVAGTWTNQPVTVRYDCSDALSGIASGGCQEDQAVGTDGITEWALGTARDNAGNTASASFGPVQLDTTAPTVLCQSAGFVYGQANAMVSAAVSDATSGPVGGQPGGTTTVSALVSTSTVGPSTVSLTGQDNAGNSTSVRCPYAVDQAQTSTSLTSSAGTSVAGQAVTFTAAVNVQSPGSGTPTNTVTFKDNGVAIGTATLGANGNPANVASLTSISLSVGDRQITAVYGGDPNFQGSTSAALTQNVDTDLSSFATTSSGAYDLTRKNLAGAYLVGADLTDATITSANLAGADLRGANLSGANLSKANLKGANLTGANLTNANLTQTNLGGATGLASATLSGVTWNKTTCPDKTVSSKDGGTCLNNLNP